MGKNMDSRTITDKLSHKTDSFQEKLSPPHHSSLRNEGSTQTRAKSGAMWMLLQEKEQRSRGRAMNVGERRYLVGSLRRRALQFSRAH